MVTPSSSGYSFSPSGISETVSDADIAREDFASSVTSSSTIGDRTDYTSTSPASGDSYSSSTSNMIKDSYSYSSSTWYMPVVKVSSRGSLTLAHSKVTKSGGNTSSTENSAFYGFNSKVLASSYSISSTYSETNQTTSISMTGCTIATAATGANGTLPSGRVLPSPLAMLPL
jgi:hypothetical protein